MEWNRGGQRRSCRILVQGVRKKEVEVGRFRKKLAFEKSKKSDYKLFEIGLLQRTDLYAQIYIVLASVLPE